MADKKISALPAASTPLAGTEVLPVVQSGATDKVSVSDLTSGRTVDMAVANAVLNDAVTNTVSYPVVATHTSSGSTAPGFGVGVNFVQENTTYSTNIQVGTIESVSTSEADIHNDMVFKTKYNNLLAERARIKNGADFALANGNFVPSTAGKGIDFSANANAPGMTSEVLTWYEEGNWTPTGGTIGATGSSGTYTRIGRQVTVNAEFTGLLSFGAGAVICSNLPFSAAASVDFAGSIIDAASTSGAFVRANSTYIISSSAITTPVAKLAATVTYFV